MSMVLITGGAGSVGREVSLQLVDLGNRVRILDLPRCDFSPFLGVAEIEIVRGSIEDAELVSRAVEGIDAVMHLSALLPPLSELDRRATKSVNVGGTAKLVDALREVSPEAHLVFSSSVCIYGDTSQDEPPVKVSLSPRPGDIYAESKTEAEQLVRDSGLRYTTLRISGVSVPAFLAPPAVWPFMPAQRIEYVCRTDAMAALVACVENSAAEGKIFNVAGGPSWRLRGSEYVAHFNEVMGLPEEEGAYLGTPGWFDWYETGESQAALGYQRTSFYRFLELLAASIEEALS